MSRPLTPAEERLLAHLERKPEITEHLVAALDAAIAAKGDPASGERHVIMDFRIRHHAIQDAEVSTPRRVGLDRRAADRS